MRTACRRPITPFMIPPPALQNLMTAVRFMKGFAPTLSGQSQPNRRFDCWNALTAPHRLAGRGSLAIGAFVLLARSRLRKSRADNKPRRVPASFRALLRGMIRRSRLACVPHFLSQAFVPSAGLSGWRPRARVCGYVTRQGHHHGGGLGDARNAVSRRADRAGAGCRRHLLQQ